MFNQINKSYYLKTQKNNTHNLFLEIIIQKKKKWRRTLKIILRKDSQKNKIDLIPDTLQPIQGLGSLITTNIGNKKVETYVKGENCEASIKQLCVFCRKDLDKPIAKQYLAQYKVLQRDLINLLTGYPQDKVLSYYLLILLESMTNYSLNEQLIDHLQVYKANFLRPLVMQTLINHFGECVQIPQECRSKAQLQLIELIILLFRNLLLIPDVAETKIDIHGTGELQRNMQKYLIQAMIKESVLAGFIFISQDFTHQFIQKLSIPLLFIFYQCFTPFEQEWLLNEEDDWQQKYKALKQQSMSERPQLAPPRHSRFSGFYSKIRENGTQQLHSQPFQEKSINKLANQRLKPQQRALVTRISTIFTKDMSQNLFDSDTGKYLKEELRTYTVDFLQHSFSRLILAAYNQLNKEIMVDEDKVCYFLLIAYFMRFSRLFQKKNAEKNIKSQELSSEFVSISEALQLTQFEFLYSTMIHEIQKNKKRLFNYRLFYAVVHTLNELFHIVRELSLSTQGIDRKNSQILMQNIFSHDISKAIRIGFQYCQQGLFNDDMLKTIIIATSQYFDLLESYSKGKVLSIRTNRMLKKKAKKANKKKQKKQQLEGQENQEEDQMFQQEDEQEEDDESETDEEEQVYQERKTNLKAEFTTVVDYAVLEKYFYMIQNNKILDNAQDLNIAIYKYFKRIVDLLKAEWIFFQVDFLFHINHILHNHIINYRSEFANLLKLFRTITVSFITYFKINKMLSVECLFRFPDANTKELILRNYALEQNQDEPQIIQQERKAIWSQLEDKTLIDNYERYKEFDNPEEQLSLLLNNLGFSMKSLQDIRKRIRKFKLSLGMDAAIKKYHQMYEKMSMKKEEIMAQSVKFQLAKIGEANFDDFFDEFFKQVISYIQFREQEEEKAEIPIPPLNMRQFQYLDQQNIQSIILGLGFNPPQQGEIYWRIPVYLQEGDILIMYETLKIYKQKARKVEVIEDVEYRPLQVDQIEQSNRKSKQTIDDDEFEVDQIQQKNRKSRLTINDDDEFEQLHLQEQEDYDVFN
ncbi:hypothetical protein pb186bvf_018412 [Paramecium bursaria]